MKCRLFCFIFVLATIIVTCKTMNNLAPMRVLTWIVTPAPTHVFASRVCDVHSSGEVFQLSPDIQRAELQDSRLLSARARQGLWTRGLQHQGQVRQARGWPHGPHATSRSVKDLDPIPTSSCIDSAWSDKYKIVSQREAAHEQKGQNPWSWNGQGPCERESGERGGWGFPQKAGPFLQEWEDFDTPWEPWCYSQLGYCQGHTKSESRRPALFRRSKAVRSVR